MAITFVEEKKRQKKLLFIFGALLVITAGVLAIGFLRKMSPINIDNQAITSAFRKADIDFTILDNPVLKDLEPFEGIKSFEGKIGRDNPFLPY